MISCDDGLGISGEDIARDARMTERVREIMQRQPINQFEKLKFVVMDKWPRKEKQDERNS